MKYLSAGKREGVLEGQAGDACLQPDATYKLALPEGTSLGLAQTKLMHCNSMLNKPAEGQHPHDCGAHTLGLTALPQC